MRKITINLAAVAAFCIVVASPALVSSSCATPKTVSYTHLRAHET